MLKDAQALIRRHGALIAAVIIILGPTCYGIAAWHFNQQLAVLREQISFLEMRLQHGAMPTPTPNDAGGPAGPGTTPAASPQAPYPHIMKPNALSRDEVARLAAFIGSRSHGRRIRT